jgi:hypothetical protein
VAGSLTASQAFATLAEWSKAGRGGSVKGSVLGLTPGRLLESSQRDEQHWTPPSSGRASFRAFIPAVWCPGAPALPRAARIAARRQIGHEHTWWPPTVIPAHWQWCSSALARGTRPGAPERATTKSAAASRQGKRAEKPLSTRLR